MQTYTYYTIPAAQQYTWLNIANGRAIYLADRVANARDSDMLAMWMASYRELLDAVEVTFGADKSSQLRQLFESSLAEARAAQKVAS